MSASLDDRCRVEGSMVAAASKVILADTHEDTFLLKIPRTDSRGGATPL
jgi:hypothetical protein